MQSYIHKLLRNMIKNFFLALIHDIYSLLPNAKSKPTAEGVSA